MHNAIRTNARATRSLRHKGLVWRIFGFLITLQSDWKQRQKLLTLDARALDDIGLSRDEAMAEAARPIWDVPHNWRV